MSNFKKEWNESYNQGDNNILYPQAEVVKFLNRFICKRNNNGTLTRNLNNSFLLNLSVTFYSNFFILLSREIRFSSILKLGCFFLSNFFILLNDSTWIFSSLIGLNSLSPLAILAAPQSL